jgi:hypothetical protein
VITPQASFPDDWMTENNTIRGKTQFDAHGTAALNVLASWCVAFDQGGLLFFRPDSGLSVGAIPRAESPRSRMQQRRTNAAGVLLIPAYHSGIRLSARQLESCVAENRKTCRMRRPRFPWPAHLVDAG